MTIKAIETEYRNHKFRSRTEARWAVLFDELKIEWEYEKEGFEFEDGTKYLPDFWLPYYFLWVEIKGEGITDEAKHKANELAKVDEPVIILNGPPDQLYAYRAKHSDQKRWWLIWSFIQWIGTNDDGIRAYHSARFEFGERG